jgi:hypothetical protein
VKNVCFLVYDQTSEREKISNAAPEKGKKKKDDKKKTNSAQTGKVGIIFRTLT